MIDDKLNPNQQNEARGLLQGTSDTLSDLPGRTQCIEHRIQLVDDKPFRIKQYSLPVLAIDAVNNEFDIRQYAYFRHHKTIIVTIRFFDHSNVEKG